jgi:hypothetical protein
MRIRYLVRNGQRFGAELWVLSCGGNSRRKPAETVAGIGCGLHQTNSFGCQILHAALFSLSATTPRAHRTMSDSSPP